MVVIDRETFRLAGVTDDVCLVYGEVREHLQDHKEIAFCFFDAEKEITRHFMVLLYRVLYRGASRC